MIKHLLNHTAGVGNITAQHDFLLQSYQPRTPDELIQWIIACPFESIPGEKFIYSNSGYIILGKIIEVISGISYEEFLKKKIFYPISIINTGIDLNHNIQNIKQLDMSYIQIMAYKMHLLFICQTHIQLVDYFLRPKIYIDLIKR